MSVTGSGVGDDRFLEERLGLFPLLLLEKGEGEVHEQDRIVRSHGEGGTELGLRLRPLVLGKEGRPQRVVPEDRLRDALGSASAGEEAAAYGEAEKEERPRDPRAVYPARSPSLP